MDESRQLILMVFLRAVADAKLGDGDALTWLNNGAAETLRLAGFHELASQGLRDWLDANAVALADALRLDYRCKDCWRLLCQDGRCKCTAGQWEAQGRAPDYAIATVKNDGGDFIKGCIYYREDEDMTSLNTVIQQFTERWEGFNQWHKPTWEDALDFMVTEAGEALDAKLRLGADYWRTHPDNATVATLKRRLLIEIGQVVIMAALTVETLFPGLTVEDAVRAALQDMEDVRAAKREREEVHSERN